MGKMKRDTSHLSLKQHDDKPAGPVALETKVVGPPRNGMAKTKLEAVIKKFCATNKAGRKLFFGGSHKQGYLFAHGHAAILITPLSPEFDEMVFELTKEDKVPVKKGKVKKALSMDWQKRMVEGGVKEFSTAVTLFKEARWYKLGAELCRVGNDIITLYGREQGVRNIHHAYVFQGTRWIGRMAVKMEYLDTILALAGKTVFDDDWVMTTGNVEAIVEKTSKKGFKPMYVHASKGGAYEVEAIFMPIIPAGAIRLP